MKEVSSIFKEFKCHKVVSAFKIGGIEPSENTSTSVNLLNEEGTVFPIPKEWVKKRDPAVGGYVVRYSDGYISFSPSEAFEEGYSEIFFDTDHATATLRSSMDAINSQISPPLKPSSAECIAQEFRDKFHDRLGTSETLGKAYSDLMDKSQEAIDELEKNIAGLQRDGRQGPSIEDIRMFCVRVAQEIPDNLSNIGGIINDAATMEAFVVDGKK